MSYETTYQAAKNIASKVEKHFQSHITTAINNGEENIAAVPSAAVIEALIDASFWASLRSEEGHYPRISIAFLSPEQALHPLVFNKRFKLDPSILTKLAPGIEGAGIHLGVWFDGQEIYIWGSTTYVPDYCFVLDVSEPGLLVIKHRRIHGFGKFANVMILKGDEIKVVDEESGILADSPPILRSLLDFTFPYLRNDAVNILIQLAVSMRAHGHGGALLIVPQNQTGWRQSIVEPITYEVSPAFTGLSDLIKHDGDDINESLWLSKLKREVDNIGGLTAIDGATIINDRYDLLAFGAKIQRKKGSVTVEKVAISEPVIGGEARITHPGSIGGTRHLSAAQFVHDQHDAIALVASQDGHFTVFSWSASAQIVQANRVETLLL